MNAGGQLIDVGVNGEYVELAAQMYSMLAEPTRIRLNLALRDRVMSVNELAQVVGKTEPATSQHPTKMRLSRMASTRQDGNEVFYRLENEHAWELVVNAVFQVEHVLGGVAAHHESAGSDQ